MRRFALAILTVLACFPLAHADEPDLSELNNIATKTEPARDRWERCLAAYAKGQVQRKRPAADIARKALKQCKARERDVGNVLAKDIGAERAVNVMAALREMLRDNLVAAIEQLRREPRSE